MVLALTEFLRNREGGRRLSGVPRRRRSSLTLGDRATISNMAPEYGATAAMFSIDQQTIDYLRLTGRERRAGGAGRDLREDRRPVGRLRWKAPSTNAC